MSCLVTVTKSTVIVWDLSTGKRIPIYETDKDITTATLDDRERKLIIGDDYGAINVFNLMNGAHIKSIDSHPDGETISDVHFCPTNRLVISSSWGGHIQISDENDLRGAIEGKRSVKFRSIQLLDDTLTGCDITTSAMSFHFKQIATFAENQLDRRHEPTCVCIWDLEYADIFGVCPGAIHANYVSLRFAEKLDLLFGVDANNNTLTVWSVCPTKRSHSFKVLLVEHLEETPSCVNIMDDKYILVGTDHGGLLRYDLDVRAEQTRIKFYPHPCRDDIYKGNRVVHHDVRMVRVRAVAGAALMRVGTPDRSSSNGPATDRPDLLTLVWCNKQLVEGEMSNVSTLANYQEDLLIFVGLGTGYMCVVQLETGTVLENFDAVNAKSLPPKMKDCFDFVKIQVVKEREAEELIDQVDFSDKGKALVPSVSNRSEPQKPKSSGSRDPIKALLDTVKARKLAKVFSAGAMRPAAHDSDDIEREEDVYEGRDTFELTSIPQQLPTGKRVSRMSLGSNRKQNISERGLRGRPTSRLPTIKATNNQEEDTLKAKFRRHSSALAL